MIYYLYISDSKVDMLLPQYALKQAARTAEFSLSLKIFSMKVASAEKSLDERISRVEAVSTCIREAERVGDITAGEPWIIDEANAAMTTFERDGAVFFFGCSGDTAFALGGSAHNLVGNARGSSPPFTYSYMPFLLRQLRHQWDTLADLPQEQRDIILERFRYEDPWVQVISGYAASAAPRQRITFLARRLLTDVGPNGHGVVLATPVYVALSDDQPINYWD